MQISHAYDDFGRAGWTGRAVDGGNAGGWMIRHWDALGRLLDQSNKVNTSGHEINWTFAYNPAGQLRQSTQDTEVYDYAPDIQAAEAKTFDGLNRDATIAGVTGGYDLRGNLTFDGNRTFVYDVENRLISASGTTIPGATFEYDPEGRLSKITSGTTVTTFLYDGVNLIGEYDGAGNLKRRYIHGDGTDNPLVWLEETPTGEERRFFQKNYQGSIIGWSDDQGNLTEMYRYGAYGEPMGETGTNELWNGSRFRYTGQTVLTEARLYYYKARVYDPKFGRFLQTDPIGTKDDLDLYAYVAGDPVNRGDPDGMQTVPLGQTGMSDEDYMATMGGYKAMADFVAAHPGQTMEIIGTAAQLIPHPFARAGGRVVGGVGRAVRAIDGEGLGTAVPITEGPTTLSPGPYARDSVPATSSGATPAERQQVTQIERKSGCHTCGKTDPGTNSGDFVPDHQPATKLNPPGGKQDLYPHCIKCMQKQGGEVRAAVANKRRFKEDLN